MKKLTGNINIGVFISGRGSNLKELIKNNIQLTAILFILKKTQHPQRLHDERCNIVRTLLSDSICVDMTMHMRAHRSIRELIVSMVHHAEVVYLHRTEVVRTPRLLFVEYWELHVLAVVDNKSVRPLRMRLVH